MNKREQISQIFRERLALNQHGGFLTRFMEAWLFADVYNQELLEDAALKLIEKYMPGEVVS